MILIWWYVSDFFEFVYDFFSNIISWIISAASFITSCISFLVDLFNALPAFFIVPLVALVSISVIYKLLGREGQN